jgi:tetrahydromethanopterin S-methyltransferase subunit G
VNVSEDHDRLVRVEALAATTSSELHEFRGETRRDIGGLRSTITGLAITIATSALGIAAAVVFTR